METNESILTREIVSIDDRKKLGKIKDMCIDCGTRAVSHYIVGSATTGSSVVLPFEKSLAVGDTFMMVQNRDDFISPSESEAKQAIEEGFRMIGVEVFSRAGNRLGTVESYEFDPTYGLITKIVLGKRLSYPADSFVFFAPDFIFVDDGEATAHDVRTGTKGKARKKINVRKTSAKAPQKVSVIAAAKRQAQPDFEAEAELKEAVEEKATTPVDDAVAAAADSASQKGFDENDKDIVLKEFLLGAVVNDNVKSKDGSFKVNKGTKLTKELINEAQKCDALLLLTMSVDA